MGIKCGIVGLPNAGKSTLFNALTAAGIPAENYPFCTIDPNVGVVNVPDQRLETIAGIARAQRTVPAVVEFVDIAGLVSGASRGEGLGNRFLAHIRETDAVAHVIRCFTGENVTHVSGRLDSVADAEIVSTELLLADLDSAERAFEKAERQAKTNEKEALAWRDLLGQVLEGLRAGTAVRDLELSPGERSLLKNLHLITAKPVMYIANVDEAATAENPLLDRLVEHAGAENAPVVTISATFEAALAELSTEEQDAFLSEAGLKEPGLHRVVRAAYRLLDLRTFYTAGPKEARAWTVPRRASAYDAAGVIHTDFQRGFIRAEVIPAAAFIARGGEQGAKEAGEMRLEGKDYSVAEGDVIHFRFNV